MLTITAAMKALYEVTLMEKELLSKKLFALPEILTLSGHQVTGDVDEQLSGDCKDGCCDGNPVKGKSGSKTA